MTGRGGGGEVWICIFLLSCCHHLGVDQYDYNDQEGSPHDDDDDNKEEGAACDDNDDGHDA